MNKASSSKPPELVGRRLGEFQLKEKMGEGGFGAIYRAEQVGLERPAVVKILRSRFSADETTKLRFLREARLACSLDHPYAAHVYAFGAEPDGVLWIAMELVRGETLSRMLHASPMALPAFVPFFERLCEVVETAHEHGIVHRDIKPQNVMVITRAGALLPKLLDLGIAKDARAKEPARSDGAERSAGAEASVSSPRVNGTAASADESTVINRAREGEGQLQSPELLTGEGDIVGSPSYMAPEQWVSADRVTRQSDIYALGVLAYEAITGHPPFSGTVEELARQHLRKPVPPLPAAIPAELYTVLVRAMAKNPDERQVAALELGREFRRASGVRSDEADVAAPSHEARPADAKEPADGPAGESVSRVVALPPPAVRGRRAVALVSVAALGIAGVLAWPGGRAWLGALVRDAGGRRGAGSTVDATRGPAVSARAEAGVARCEHNVDCGEDGLRVCRSGRCIELASEDCHVVAAPGTVASDRALWFGAMFPQVGSFAEESGKVYARGLEVAWEDFDEITHGLPSPDGTGPVRPIGLLFCDDSQHATSAAHHLADDVQVPAIFGFGTSQELIELAPTVFIPQGTLAMSVMNSSPLISTIPTPPGRERLVWRSALAGGSIIEPVTRLVPQLLAPALVARGALHPGEALRVALIRYDDVLGLSQFDLVTHALEFNRKSALDNGHNFEQFLVEGREDNPEKDADVVAGILRMAPHVILQDGGDSFMHRIIAPVEKAWKAGARPIYVSFNDVGGPSLNDVLAREPTLRERYYGVYAPLGTPTGRRFAMRYNERLPEAKKVNYTGAPGSAYDGFYSVVYASYVASLSSQDITGSAIARAIPSLCPPGEPVEVGPGSILSAFDLLRRTKHVDLTGASTAMDFDVTTGEVTGDLVLQCMQPVKSGGFESHELDVRYHPRERQWTGTVRCP